MPTDPVQFLGVRFDPLTMSQVLERMAAISSDSPYGYVVTPNVDHVVQLDRAPDRIRLRQIVAGATLSVCDSRILQKLASLLNVKLPVVPGSDLTVRLFNDVLAEGDIVSIVGGDEKLPIELGQRYPHLIFKHYQPPMGLRGDTEARAKAASFIANTRARFAFIAVGSPQQEMIAAEAASFAGARGMALCIGASLDFIVGRQRRAPKLIQSLRLEWAFRLGSNPKRLWRRYLVEGPHVFRLAFRELTRRT